MAQSEIRGGDSEDRPPDPDGITARPQRETRTVTGHPEAYPGQDRESPSSADDDGPEAGEQRPASRFQSNRVSPAERDGIVQSFREVRFPVALRGYERVAVDRYVREVNRLIAELEISSSPESAVRHALDEVSEETREILQRAHQSAEELTARSRAKADDRLQQVEAEAQELRAAGQREADEMREQAAAEAADTRERATAEARELRETAAAEARELRETAAAEARELREDAAREADQLRLTATQDAQRTRTTAERESGEQRADARRDAEETIETAEARVRELAHSAETLWRERRRLIEDMRELGEQLVAMGEAEAKRFPRFSEDISDALHQTRSAAPPGTMDT